MAQDDMRERALAALPAFIEVTIRYEVRTGSVVKIDGPMDSPAMMFGILELAREALYVHRAKTLKRETAAVVTGKGILDPS